MRRELEIDMEALAAAMRVAPGSSESEVVNAALRAFALRKRNEALLELRGKVCWEGDIDELRGRKS